MKDLPVADWAAEEGIADQEIRERIEKATDSKMAEKGARFGPDIMRMVEKDLLLQMLDQNWKDHLLQLDHLRQGIGLRAYGQRDPLNEYKQEAFSLFEDLLNRLRESVTQLLARIELRTEEPPQSGAGRDGTPAPGGGPRGGFDPSSMRETRQDPAFGDDAPEGGSTTVIARRPAGKIDPNNPATWGKVQRNAACPCGSGKKYKHCHGKVG